MQIVNETTQVSHASVHKASRTVTVTEHELPDTQRSGGTRSELAADRQQPTEPEKLQPSSSLTPAQQLRKAIVEHLGGYEFKTFVERDESEAEKRASKHADTDELTLTLTAQQNQQAPREVTRVITESVYEFEQLDFSTQVLLKDDKGDQSAASFTFTYERELSIERLQITQSIEFTDPLIVNLGNNGELFADGSHHFDLDEYGDPEIIPSLADDVWYLAYDRNDIGIIDNGSELFGAQTGQGFEELAALDDDDDGLIERDDQHFQHLQLWDGRHVMTPIQESGIQAISLNATHTPFTFTDDLGQPLARLRQSAVFISDENQLGAVHQVDFVV